MPKAIYETIYKDLKQKIEQHVFAYQELLPSETYTNTNLQGCPRNTLRRAIRCLVTDGYVQTIQGKGVRNIYQPVERRLLPLGKLKVSRNLLPEMEAMLPRKSCCLLNSPSMKGRLSAQDFQLEPRYTISSVFII